jgi:hypothetical protein
VNALALFTTEGNEDNEEHKKLHLISSVGALASLPASHHAAVIRAKKCRAKIWQTGRNAN